MDATGLNHRRPPTVSPETEAPEKAKPKSQHPGGVIKHGTWDQALRMLLFGLYFNMSIICIFITQLIGAPLYFYEKDLFYAWMAMTKQHFGLVLTTMTQWWAPTTVRISGDESVRGQLRQTEDGRFECDFPERMVLVSNHQIYTDWVYLWWISYTAKMHGHIYIILKESIKYIPILGQGMMFYGFIFLSRKWAKDKDRFQYRLQKLNSSHSGPLSGTQSLDPMWLLIFPEGTNLCANGRIASKKWADKTGIEDLRHALLPRSTGLQFCLQELGKTVDWMYDCTVAYEGVPKGEYGQDIFTLRSTYFQGRPPKSVNMHWRRFAIKDVPYHDNKAFEAWLLERWREKDDLLEYYLENGRFPADDGVSEGVNGSGKVRGAGYIETQVRPKNPLEVVLIAAPPFALGLVINVIYKFWLMVLTVLRLR